MQDSEVCPQRRSAIVAKELVRLNIDTAALSKVSAKNKAPSQRMEQAIPSSDLERIKMSTASLVLAP